MSSVSRPARGSFVDARDDLLPSLAVQPHQASAATALRQPVRAIVGGRKLSNAALARYVNDFLSDPSVK